MKDKIKTETANEDQTMKQVLTSVPDAELTVMKAVTFASSNAEAVRICARRYIAEVTK